MGYTTYFDGEFKLDKPLNPDQIAYLKKFNETRRVKRNASKTAKRTDPLRKAVGLPVGKEGGYFVNEGGFAGQQYGSDVVEGNYPPFGQPGLWCQWVPTEDGAAIVWDEGEKFYEYESWISYLIDHFLKPWGYVLNGEVTWEGEEPDDFGVLRVEDNVVTTHAGERFIPGIDPDPRPAPEAAELLSQIQFVVCTARENGQSSYKRAFETIAQLLGL